jgi:hypothetical protein
MTAANGRRTEWVELHREAIALIEAAGERGLTLRVVGSTGVRAHCEPAAATMDLLHREAKDIDLVCRGRDRTGLRLLLEERGYEIDRDMLVSMEGSRFFFRHPERGIELDLFVDRLEFCHTIELRDRLDHHPITIPLEDLLLQKLQIVELKGSDILDLATLLAAHDVSEGPGEPEAVDSDYVASLLARDWGFHRTATANLERFREAVDTGEAPGLDPGARDRVGERATALLSAIQGAHKSLAWRVRARVGERMQWWSEVGERTETY